MAKEIGYDLHENNIIEFYYFVDVRTGKDTCMASCQHCFLRTNQSIAGFRQDVKQAEHIIKNLRSQNYKVTPIVSESFANNGEYLRTDLFKNNSFFMGSMAWSSGMPLIKNNYKELLQLVVNNNIQLIAMTSHGINNNDSPLKGVMRPSVVRESVSRIKKFNKEFSQSLKISLIFNIGKWNNSYKAIRSYFEYSESLGVDVIRINQFIDFSGKYPEFRLNGNDIKQVYRTLKEINDSHRGDLQLSVSEDFGFWGIDVMEFPSAVGNCAAGSNLFGIIYPYIYVCPEAANIIAGAVDSAGDVTWEKGILEKVRFAKKHESYSGCFGASYTYSEEIRSLFK